MWKVTYDLLEKKEVTNVESVDWNLTMDTKLFHFRMLDDDNIVYYKGVCDSNDDNAAFRPLDDYGTPNAGCTSIQYKDGSGEWETL